MRWLTLRHEEVETTASEDVKGPGGFLLEKGANGSDLPENT